MRSVVSDTASLAAVLCCVSGERMVFCSHRSSNCVRVASGPLLWCRLFFVGDATFACCSLSSLLVSERWLSTLFVPPFSLILV